SSGSCGGGGIITRNNMWRGSLTSYVFMVNAYAAIGSWYGITPFVGGGVGFASHLVHGVSDFDPSDLGGGGFASDNRSSSFAWNVQAGLQYDIAPNLVFETAYRYIDMGSAESGRLCGLPAGCSAALAPLQIDDITAHEIRLGLRWRLGGHTTPVHEVGYGPGRG
ncbi:MAG: outer membrane beta-barrel protein, partial [Fimbriimonadaceae bacterium]|nr:outer membrane beta-barrel protein [Alphaproteobacteria bacterium]